MTAAHVDLAHMLKRFPPDQWIRPSWVHLNNRQIAPLVDAGLLEQRTDPDPTLFGKHRALEYRRVQP